MLIIWFHLVFVNLKLLLICFHYQPRREEEEKVSSDWMMMITGIMIVTINLSLPPAYCHTHTHTLTHSFFSILHFQTFFLFRTFSLILTTLLQRWLLPVLLPSFSSSSLSWFMKDVVFETSFFPWHLNIKTFVTKVIILSSSLKPVHIRIGAKLSLFTRVQEYRVLSLVRVITSRVDHGIYSRRILLYRDTRLSSPFQSIYRVKYIGKYSRYLLSKCSPNLLFTLTSPFEWWNNPADPVTSDQLSLGSRSFFFSLSLSLIYPLSLFGLL